MSTSTADRLDITTALAGAKIGSSVTLRENHNTHPPRPWTIVSIEGDTVRAEGLAYPCASASVIFTFTVCPEHNGMRRTTRRGSDMWHAYAA